MLFRAEPIETLSEESDFISDYEVYAIRMAQNGQQLADFIEYYRQLGWPAQPELILGWKYIFSLERRIEYGTCTGNYDGNLEFLRETHSDLCLVHKLIKMNYPKQALQTLRGALEVLVGNAFLRLKGQHPDTIRYPDDFRWSCFSGNENSMLSKLQAARIIDEGQRWLLRAMYCELSRSVHCHFSHLNINAGESETDYRYRVSRQFIGVGEAVLPLVKNCLVRGG